ncbi:MAG: hypothetical protein KUG67_01185 [Proteobacteria bacterium]|nr:hypothetical protein [Pseudomonadota bacterium]
MHEEYDFSKGERGKFFNPNAKKNLPVYLEAEVLDYFSAKAKGVELNTMVNDLLIGCPAKPSLESQVVHLGFEPTLIYVTRKDPTLFF